VSCLLAQLLEPAKLRLGRVGLGRHAASVPRSPGRVSAGSPFRGTLRRRLDP
jgi:hypothetical protein